jgi:hypothetical protein
MSVPPGSPFELATVAQFPEPAAPATLPSDVPLDFPADFQTPFDAPLGFAGPSGILPRDVQSDPRFIPIEDRWRIGFPEWDRYGKGHPPVDDYPYVIGRWLDPYNQNYLKGDYPILGQNTFLELTATSRSLVEPRQVPTPANGFESTLRPFESNQFGRPGQLLYSQYMILSFDLFHGDGAFRPADWRIKLTPVFNFNYLGVQEVGVVSPDVRNGTTRARSCFCLEEWLVV